VSTEIPGHWGGTCHAYAGDYPFVLSVCWRDAHTDRRGEQTNMHTLLLMAMLFQDVAHLHHFPDTFLI